MRAQELNNERAGFVCSVRPKVFRLSDNESASRCQENNLPKCVYEIMAEISMTA